jgi:hypothetical protein
MSKPSTSFRLGDVITGEPHLYVANPPAPADSLAESPDAAPVRTSLLKRCVAAIQRAFRLGPTPDDSLARAFDRAFLP